MPGDMESEQHDVLPDVLDYGLKIVFCGTAAGRISAAIQSYYAPAKSVLTHPGDHRLDARAASAPRVPPATRPQPLGSPT